MLDLAVLGLLKEGDLHGYELNKRLKSLVGGYANSYGALYPALARLERRGWVSSTAVAPELVTDEQTSEGHPRRNRKRSTRSKSGRTRKVYQITEAGEDHLLELLQEDANNERRFRLQLAFCRFLPPDRRLALFELRRAHLVSLQAMARRDPVHSNDPYVRSLFERDQERREHDLAWLDRLIADEQSKRQSGANPDPIDP
ncbi:MAG: helix-turn-helix transcriptional regulator [Acidimicrobiia bacterium]|nr:helix-turn-helix transcriptional regulator [Acidimicrobiia bacterium]MYG71849.1 helix-turn-helix transcriptional regulator [Acidimicrobiia bacterium]